MTTQSTDENDELREKITRFMQSNFPQIKMHGGNATITNIDREESELSIQLGGACSGCGISPMTIQALKSRLPKEIPEIETVHADTGEETSDGVNPSFTDEESDDSDNETTAPF